MIADAQRRKTQQRGRRLLYTLIMNILLPKAAFCRIIPGQTVFAACFHSAFRPENLLDTAPDAGVQLEILQLVGALRSKLNMAVLLVTHDLAMVRSIADSVQVMQEGCIVEAGAAAEIFSAPRHPYTKMLLDVPDHSVNPLTMSRRKILEAEGPGVSATKSW